MGTNEHSASAILRLRRTGRPTRYVPAALALLAGLVLALVPAAGCQPSIDDRIDEARSLQELGAWEESVDALREILETAPERAEANYLLGRAQLRLGQPSLAVWPLQLAQRDPEVAVDASLALAGAYLQLDQLEAAVEAADQVLADASASAEARAGALRVRVAASLAGKEWDVALEDAERLLEFAPGDSNALAMRAHALLNAGRPEEAEETLRELWRSEVPEDAAAVARAGIGLVGLYAEELEDAEAAAAQFDALLERFPANRDVLRFAVAHLREQEQPDRAEALLRRSLEEAPGALELRAWVAAQMAALGHEDEGEAMLVEGTEIDGGAASWLHLSDYRREHGDLPGALEAMERTVELAQPVSDVLAFRYADLLLRSGEIDRVEALAKEISEPSYKDVLLGGVAFDRGDYAVALERLDGALRRWPNNAGARHLAGQAAYALGQVDRALAEFREAVRSDAGATDAALDGARLHLARGEASEAMALLQPMLAALRGSGPSDRLRDGTRLLAKAQIESGRVEGGTQTLKQLAGLPGGALPAHLEYAALLAGTQGPEAAAKRLADADLDLTDPAHGEGLRAWSQYLVEAGRAGEALARLDAAVEAHPERAVLHDVRGRLLFNAGRVEEARAAFERALEREPDLAPALEGLARVAEATGDPDRALELFDRAAEVEPAAAGAVYAAAQLALRRGDVAEAERRLRETLQRDPLHAEASNDLAWILAERGEDLDRALVLAEQAAARRRSANVLDTLGWVQLRRGEAEAAAETLREARTLAPESASIAYRLSLALVETGEPERAAELLREALASGAFPEDEQAREELARLTATDS